MNKSYYDKMQKIFGNHSIKEAAKNPKRKYKVFYGTEELYRKLELKCAFQFWNGDPFLLVDQLIHYSSLEEMKQSEKILLIDQIEDPRNLGAIIRTAAVLGFNILYRPGVMINETVVKCASGGLEYVKIAILKNTMTTLKELKKDFWVVAFDEKGVEISNQIKKKKIILIIGAEGNGISQMLLKSTDYHVKISGVNGFSTLNASVAAAIGMYESLRFI